MGKCGSKNRRNDFDYNNLGSFNKLLTFILKKSSIDRLSFDYNGLGLGGLGSGGFGNSYGGENENK